MHSTSPGPSTTISPDVVQVLRTGVHSVFANGMTQSLRAPSSKDVGESVPVVSSIQLTRLDRNLGSDAEEKIYDDPYELMMGDDEWLSSPTHGGPNGMSRSRSWLCCPNSTTSTAVAGGGEEWRRRNDIIRCEYSSLVTTQPARGNDEIVNASDFIHSFRFQNVVYYLSVIICTYVTSVAPEIETITLPYWHKLLYSIDKLN